MKTKYFAVPYAAPTCCIYGLSSEGVLCSSMNSDFSANDLKNGQTGWFEDDEQ